MRLARGYQLRSRASCIYGFFTKWVHSERDEIEVDDGGLRNGNVQCLLNIRRLCESSKVGILFKEYPTASPF